MKYISKFKHITPNTKILEIGSGLGWILILCSLNDLNYKGLEISPQLLRAATENSKKYGINLDIKLGNVETTNLGKEIYDVIIASSVFEHVLKWKTGLKSVYNALKPTGLFYFVSTNKFNIKSG